MHEFKLLRVLFALRHDILGVRGEVHATGVVSLREKTHRGDVRLKPFTVSRARGGVTRVSVTNVYAHDRVFKSDPSLQTRD